MVLARSAMADLEKAARSSGYCSNDGQCSEELEVAAVGMGRTPELVIPKNSLRTQV